MSKAMDRLEKLTYFTGKATELRVRQASIQAEAEALDKEFGKFLEVDLGIKGNVHMAEVLKQTLETSFEVPRIATP